MNYIVYKTTNIINNTCYVGIHKQSNNVYEFDGYFGSGKILNLAIKKYGRKNFSRETLLVFNTLEEAKIVEAVIVNAEFSKYANTYNIVSGGGMPPSHKGISKSEDHKNKIGKSNRKSKPKASITRKNQIKVDQLNREWRTNGVLNSKAIKTDIMPEGWWKGLTYTEKMREARRKQIPWNKDKTNIYNAETLRKMSDSKKNKTWEIDPITNRKFLSERTA